MIQYAFDFIICLVILWAVFVQDRRIRNLRKSLRHAHMEGVQLHDDLRFWQEKTYAYKKLLGGDLSTAVREARGGDAPVAKTAFA